MNQSNLRLPDSKAANRVIVRKKKSARNRAGASRVEANRVVANKVVANKVAVSKADDKPCIVN